MQLYHGRWKHENKGHVKGKLKKDLGLKVKIDKNLTCGHVFMEKHIVYLFGTRRKVNKPEEVMSADICGPFQESLGKKK